MISKSPGVLATSLDAAASIWNRFTTLDALTDDVLAHITKTQGIDVTTALLYDRVCEAPQNRELIKQVEGIDELPSLHGPLPRIVVVPGAFYREHPHTGADGTRVLEVARELGWPAERLAVPSFAPMARNAAVLLEFLRAAAYRPTILVSLCKGGADVRTAMQMSGAAESMRDVCAWVNLSGIVSGTPLVDWLEARWLRCAGVRLLLRLRGQRLATLAELRRGADAPLGQRFEIPQGIAAIHVAGFPLITDLSDAWARRGHERLAHIGPNDGGGVLLADVARLPGRVYPVFGADHYLRPIWDIRPVLRKLLHVAASAASASTDAEITSTR